MSQAGYSSTPLVRKLGVRRGNCVAVLRAPDQVGALLMGLPPDVEVSCDLDGRCDIVLAFCRDRLQIEQGLPKWTAAIAPSGAVWVAWPKRSSGVRTDITENIVRDIALPGGLVDVKVCAIDETWSGLKLVIRKELR